MVKWWSNVSDVNKAGLYVLASVGSKLAMVGALIWYLHS